MKKKTVFTVLLAMVFALSFAWTAMAADDDACVDCGKCPLGQIECCVFSGQGDGYSTYFDYETRNGYCDETANANCKVVFDLCECDDPNTNFVSGKEIGVHITILNTGVYFLSKGVDIYAWTDDDLACANSYLVVSDSTGAKPNPAGWGSKEFYAKYFPAGDFTFYDKSHASVTPMEVTAGDYDCEVDCDAYAMEMVTNKDKGWILPFDLVDREFKYWFVDLPFMILNNAEIIGREGEVVRVEVCLQGATGGICRDCDDICCCIIEVGTLCCEEGDQTCIYFPYVVTGLSPWWTGVCITNYAGNASLNLTLTLTDQNGNEFVWQKDNHTPRLWAFVIDSVLGNFVGTGQPVAGAAMLKVVSNEGFIDGYSFMTDGSFGGSTLARGCCAICFDYTYVDNQISQISAE